MWVTLGLTLLLVGAFPVSVHELRPSHSGVCRHVQKCREQSFPEADKEHFLLSKHCFPKSSQDWSWF